MRSTNSNASDAQLEDDLTFGIFTISHIGFISHLKSLTYYNNELEMKDLYLYIKFEGYEVFIYVFHITVICSRLE